MEEEEERSNFHFPNYIFVEFWELELMLDGLIFFYFCSY